MPRSPYQPQTAMTGDASSHVPPRPSSVRFACYLILASLFVGFLTLLPFIEIPGKNLEDVQANVWAIYIVLQAIPIWITYSMYRRRNWARWTLVAFLTLGWLLDGIDSTPHSDEFTLAGAVYLTVVAMQVAALWLLFTGTGAKWFSWRSTVPAEA